MLADVLVTLLSFWLLLRAAGWTLRDRDRVRYRDGYSGISAATVLVLVVGIAIIFALAAVGGHLW